MSVMLSHIDFDSQELVDKEEEELNREDAQQQKELKDFLDKELNDDDLFDASFTPHQSHGLDYPEANTYPPAHFTKQQTNNEQMNGDNYGVQNGHVYSNSLNNDQVKYILDDPYGEVFISRNTDSNHVHSEPQQYRYNKYQDQTTEPYNSRISSSQPINKDDNLDHENRDSQGAHDAQLQLLYATRGKKISELQKHLEVVEEESSKDKRILQHKLTMMSSERDGLKESYGQLQKLLQEHKKDITMYQKQINIEQEEKSQLNNQLSELTEKLYVSDSTIDSLQQQIKQMNQTESLQRARAQHESMLANLRQKHEEEILSLKEKLDDLQQALAWKIEDNNRYREMLDSNSTASEVGILRHRLTTEENRNKEIQVALEKQKINNEELEEQIKMFEVVVKKPSQFSSTPFNGDIHMGKGKLDFKTPISRFQAATENNSSNTPVSGESAVRNELVKALSMNREKRDEIKTLTNQINELEKNAGVKENKTNRDDLVNKSIRSSIDVLNNQTICENCEHLQSTLKDKNKEIFNLKEAFGKEIDELKSENSIIKTNMSDLVKDFDREKTRESGKQKDTMMQFIDDAKERVRKEMSQAHEGEKQNLQQQIAEINGELLYTKEEYVKFCEEVNALEDQIRKELNHMKDLEISELKTNLENEYKDKLTRQKNELTNKYIHDLENEKTKVNLESKRKQADEIEQAITLAKVEWLHQYEIQKLKEIEVAVQSALLDMKTETNVKVEIENINKGWNERCKLMLSDCEEKWKEEIQKHKASLTEVQNMFEEKQKELQLKEAVWEKAENDLKNRILTLQAGLKPLQSEKSVNESQTSVILEAILNSNEKDINNSSHKCDCRKQEHIWKQQKVKWKRREEELSLLLEQTREQLQHALENSDTPEMFPENINSPLAENRLSYILHTKEKLWHIKELSYKKDIEALMEDCARLEARCEESEQQVIDLETKTSTQQAERTGYDNFYQQELTELKEKLLSVNQTLADSEQNNSVQQLKLKSLENEKENVMMEFEVKLQKHIIMEKSKWQAEAMKLQEEALKFESERLKNNLLVDIQNQNESGLIHDIKMQKEDHKIEIRELKQGFREKLERISDMKRKWVKEEEEKRLTLEKALKQQLSTRLNELQTFHEKFIKEQQDVWHKNMLELQQEHSKKVNNLQDELTVKENTLAQQVKSHGVHMALVKQEKDKLTVQYEERIKNIRKEYEDKPEKDISSGHTPKQQTRLYDNNSADSPPTQKNDHIIEKMRQFYLQTLHQVNKDVSAHVAATRERATREIKEAVRRERRLLLSKLKEKQTPKFTGEPDRSSKPSSYVNVSHITQKNYNSRDKQQRKSPHQGTSSFIANDKRDNQQGKSHYQVTSPFIDVGLTPYTPHNLERTRTEIPPNSVTIADSHFNSSKHTNAKDSHKYFSPDGNFSFDSTLMMSLQELPISLKKTNINS